MEAQMMHQGLITQTRAHSFFPVWVRQRELRQRLPLGKTDAFYRSLYSSISQCHSWRKEERPTHRQGLYSLEFSPEGTLLVAGCQNNSLLIFDPLSRRLIRTVRNVHTDVITHVKFLNSRIFATGSYDKTVSLWDIRNLRSRCQTLMGHSTIIANVEFSRKNEFLITSGHTGAIYIWDTKNWTRSWEINTFLPHLLRSVRLNPDQTKMIISTGCGYLLIIHDLDLITLSQDLDEFVLEMLDFATLLPANTTSGWHSCRFVSPKRRRNRVEIVSDFPNANGFNVIFGLEIHPQGWSVFSRCIDDRREREWTCVHDIQERPFERGAASRIFRERRSSSPADTTQSPLPGPSVAPPHPVQDPSLPPPNPSGAPFNERVHRRFPRLTHYIEEPHISERRIESLGVSPDGRLVCSPSDRGFRLLAFSPECSEQSVSWCGTYPRRLHELSKHTSHSDRVICTKFSPRHCFLVTGGTDGKLLWYQPVV